MPAVRATVTAVRTEYRDPDDPDFEVREVGVFDVRVDPQAAVELLEGAGWKVVKMAWWEDVKKEAIANSGFIKLEEGVSTVGILAKERPQEEEKEWQGVKRKQYLFKVKWIVLPNGERIEFDEPKTLRASMRLAGEIAEAVGKKVFEMTGGSPSPEAFPEVVPVKIRREGTGSMTRYKVVG